MYGEFILLEGQDSRSSTRLPIGETGGRSEAWLRDTLFAHPEILPIRDVDPGFGPLVPLCRELRTEAGPIDIAYIDARGQLTLVETKLWRNNEARRKVIAQVLDYARALKRWTYADLQRQVSAALGEKGDVPFQRVCAVDPKLSEHQFIDAVSRSLRAGKFLFLIMGDGIHEGVSAMAELIDRNAASAFALGLVEVALYDLGGGGVAVQPRVLARTEVIQRHVTLVQDITGETLEITDVEPGLPTVPRAERNGEETPLQAQYRVWWAPVIAAPFDDPDQEPAKLMWPNNIRASLPGSAWVTAYRSSAGGGTLGVNLGGRGASYQALLADLFVSRGRLLEELPPGTTFIEEPKGMVLKTEQPAGAFASEDEQRAWLAATLNTYVNAFRPRLTPMLAAAL